VQHKHAPRAPMPLGVWWALAVYLTALTGLAVWAIVALQQERSIQCTVYAPVDKSYQASPPSSAAGRSFAEAIHKAVDTLGCR